jgi:hypothetical protein
MTEFDIDTGEIVAGEITMAHYRRSSELSELFTALAKAQAEFVSADRAGANPHFKSRYATLESVREATRKGRQNNALALVQMPTNAAGSNIAVTRLLGHSSGQWIESTFHVAPARFDAQGAGSAVTYLRRYSLMSILGIAAEDDDGEGAAVAGPQPATKFAPAVRNPAGDVDQARAAVYRIRREIDDTVYLEELDAKGIMAPSPERTNGSSRRKNQMAGRSGRISSCAIRGSADSSPRNR